MTAQFTGEAGTRGEFVRQGNRFADRITADSAAAPGDGPDERGRWPVEPGRYRLVWSRACPWAHRAVIVRGLLGLEGAISLGTVDPIRDERGWRFTLDEGDVDPVLGIGFLADAYRRTDSTYAGRVTVPAIIDTTSGRVVTNDYPRSRWTCSRSGSRASRSRQSGPVSVQPCARLVLGALELVGRAAAAHERQGHTKQADRDERDGRDPGQAVAVDQVEPPERPQQRNCREHQAEHQRYHVQLMTPHVAPPLCRDRDRWTAPTGRRPRRRRRGR